MDPLTALSLASSIAQVLDFGTKLFKGTREIVARSSQVTVQHLSMLSSDIEGVNKGLVRHFTPLGGKVLSEEEHGLVEVANHTLELNEEIHSYLETLVQEKGSKDRWKNFKMALRMICGTKRLEELEKRLGEYRSQLTLQLLVVLNVYHSKQSVSLGELRRIGQEIIEALAVQSGQISLRHVTFRPPPLKCPHLNHFSFKKRLNRLKLKLFSISLLPPYFLNKLPTC
jgi:hypothetical protein